MPRWGCLLAVCVAVLAAAPAFAQGAATRVTNTDGYLRIEFEWADPTSLDATVENNVLIVRFGAPFRGDIRALTSEARDYLAAARLDPNGRTARFALRGDYRLHLSQSFNINALDLIPPGFDGDPNDVVSARALFEERRQAAEAEAAARLAAAQEAVAQSTEPEEIPLPLRVYVSEHDQYSRLVFDWTRPVGYRVTPTAGGAKIVFDRPAAPGLARLRIDPPPFITGAEHEVDKNELIVRLSLVEGAGLRHFREGRRVVFDATEAGDIVSGAFPPPPAAAPPTVSTEAPPTEPVAFAPEPEEPEPAASTPESSERPQGPSIARPIRAASTGVLAPPPTPTTIPTPAPTPTPSPALEDAPVSPQVALAPTLANGLALQIAPDGDNLRISFPWSEPTAAAFFTRGDHLWAVFDRATTVSIPPLQREDRRFLLAIDQVEAATATVLRFKLSTFALASAGVADNGGWSLTLGETASEPTAPIDIEREPTASGAARIKLATGAPSRLIWLDDPAIGDRIAVVTLSGPARGVIASRNYVEFLANATAHGVLIQPLTDSLSINLSDTAVTVFAADGLSLSDAVPLTLSGRAAAAQSPGFIDFEGWALDDAASFPANEQKLNNIVAERMFEAVSAQEPAPDDASLYAKEERAAKIFAAASALNQSLYAQARFFIAHHLGPEALAVLRMIDEQDETQKTTAGFLALRGVASIFTGRFEDAVEDLSNGALSRDQSAALWRGMAQAQSGAFIEARRDFRQGAPALGLYPAEQQADFALRASEAALDAKDLAAAGEHLAKVRGAAPTPLQAAHRDYLQAEIFRLVGRDMDALKLFRDVAAREIEPHASYAALGEILLSRKMGAITSSQARARLAAMQYRWRGDDLELRVLHELAKIYIQNEEYRDGLAAMRHLVQAFPGNPLAEAIIEDMQDIFRELYLEGGADELEPVTALGIYYENIDLTPLGRDGDAMIRRLADRLASVDLLDQAAELLQHQVEKRLRPGVARARVAADLALVHLMDREPAAALSAIRTTRHARLPGALNQQRRLLEARALVELERYDHALELIATDRGPSVQNLRAEIYWRTEEWSQAGHVLETALGDVWKEEAPLGSAEQSRVMRAAISFALAGDQQSLDRIRGKYAEKMSRSPQSEAFALVVGRIDRQGVRFRDLASRIAATDTLDSFIEEFCTQREAAVDASEEDGEESPGA